MMIQKNSTADENSLVKRGRRGEKEGVLSKNYSFLPRKCASVPTANTPVEDCS